MRNKKLFSTVVATALATTMAMPVMAADGGSLDVDVTTKTGVLRVEVPTQMAIAVDQFEITQTGAQIASGEFDMVNKSEMAVKVDVTSTATLGSGINLVSSVDAAKNSDGNDAWLAVAAKTASGSYDDAGTNATENYYDLTEANANVTTFGSDDLAAKQTFYLEKGTGTAAYALAVPSNNEASVSYAQFYELTAIATQPTDDDELQAAVDASDVYEVVTANNGNDGEAVTKYAKGDTVASGAFAGTNTYYTAATTPSTSVTDGTLYVYASMGTAGEAAGFTYVGKLSNAKDTWTNDDIKKVSIAYDITGVTATKFEEVKDKCTYGLYAADIAPFAVTPSIQAVSGQPVEITLNLGAGSKQATQAISMIWKEKNYNIGKDPNVSYDGATKITIAADSIDNLLNDSSNFPVTLVITFNDPDNTEVEVTLTN